MPERLKSPRFALFGEQKSRKSLMPGYEVACFSAVNYNVVVDNCLFANLVQFWFFVYE